MAAPSRHSRTRPTFAVSTRPLGQRIYEQVSAEAWAQWEERMKMILNEYRLMPWQKDAQDLMARYMEEFFFGEVTTAPPPGYVPQPK